MADAIGRLWWRDDSGAGAWDLAPPISGRRLTHRLLGGLPGTPVDTFVSAIGPAPGTTSYPTTVEGMTFAPDADRAPASVGEWRIREQLRRLWDEGEDPLALLRDEARRLGMAFWLSGPVTAAAEAAERYEPEGWLTSDVGDPLVAREALPPAVALAARVDGRSVDRESVSAVDVVLVSAGGDVAAWAAAAAGTELRVVAEIDAAQESLAPERSRALAATGWAAGADGLCLTCFESAARFGDDSARVVHDLQSPLRLQHLDKRYAASLPAPMVIGPDVSSNEIEVVDDVAAAGARVADIRLVVAVHQLAVADELAVSLNGASLPPPASANDGELVYELDAAHRPTPGANRFGVAADRAEPLAHLPLLMTAAELEVTYHYPDGAWRHPPSFDPRT